MSSVAAKFSIAEFDRMIERGVFDSRQDHRLELIRGELREMSPIGFHHAILVDYLARWSFDNLSADQAVIRIQQPLGLNRSQSVPQPDIAWVSANKRYPRPAAPETLLVIEVADSSLVEDCGEKAELYAGERIAEYWVVNIPDHVVEVFREPKRGRFTSREVMKIGAVVRPLPFPKLKLDIRRLFDELKAGT